MNLLKIGVIKANTMEHKKEHAVHYIHKDIVNHDKNLEPMPQVLARLRSIFLNLEPGTAAQAQAYKQYEYYLKLFQSGQAYLPKF